MEYTHLLNSDRMKGAKIDKEKVILFEQFIDRYCPSIYSAIARLSGLSDKEELEALSVDVLVDLWNNSEDLFKEIPPTAFIYKILLQHVFAWLRQRGNEAQIQMLQNTLLIDPAHYAPLLESGKTTSTITRLLRKALSTIRGTRHPHDHPSPPHRSPK
jgi:DNA-directed RNA polymerase specialized sigma24 family protein